MALTQITPFIGAEFTGVTYEDFQQPELWNQFVEQLHQRELVVVRSIALTPQQQLELAARLGRPIPFVLDKYRHPEFEEIMISSNEVRDNKPIGIARVGNFWHQDSSFVANPAPYTLLHGIKVPSDSGHTLFANAADVYDRLPEEWKKRIEGRKALHTVSKRLRIQAEHVGLSVAEFKAWIETKHPKVEHDLVKVDPDTGRKYLYGAPEYLDSVIGLDANDNAAFFALIDELIQAPQRVYTHEWSNNDLVAWKTQTTLHAVTDVEPGVDRTVHRISIELH
ncbi:putative taurine dioxygenase [Lysobacter capsici AZ78]|uniref:Taurine dioxygenase n=1 Tax=Lysobacter capsici AZ78 TaxID=1444315 RepID=A0A125U059_9GAMM|nr:TauD/TfdA family dioxygenase [Lysobacter capsici]ATE72468.1 TauD/TfdA family dioxygenase [Lysobacter capsici]KWS02403.1 putative taurine dioxygenase [Lysobacter capsici AZ78]WND78580.1 TauD/TfdA family dioxygenase [Lysobacter capsici]WND83775.1 TauD/TfdA family dioxygenase [Lysobacter capsici]